MIQAYFVRYRLYGVNNTIHFHAFSQYVNWLDVMEQNFGEFFLLSEVLPYDM